MLVEIRVRSVVLTAVKLYLIAGTAAKWQEMILLMLCGLQRLLMDSRRRDLESTNWTSVGGRGISRTAQGRGKQQQQSQRPAGASSVVCVSTEGYVRGTETRAAQLQSRVSRRCSTAATERRPISDSRADSLKKWGTGCRVR